MRLEQFASKAPNHLPKDLRVANVVNSCSPEATPPAEGKYNVARHPVQSEDPLLLDEAVVPNGAHGTGVSK